MVDVYRDLNTGQYHIVPAGSIVIATWSLVARNITDVAARERFPDAAISDRVRNLQPVPAEPTKPQPPITTLPLPQEPLPPPPASGNCRLTLLSKPPVDPGWQLLQTFDTLEDAVAWLQQHPEYRCQPENEPRLGTF